MPAPHQLSSALLIVILASLVDSAPSSRLYNPYPAIPGIVPVFIRPGDTPLRDINADLAQAFEFNAQKHGRIAFGRKVSELLKEKSKLKSLNRKTKIPLDEQENLISPEENSSSHIQKIPKSVY
ncbi:uncharacterized protein LOC115882164 [Sitophilus oryzae]|uniref:Uncharacterized protein LOC115882164 n=1 Tax=Sitophilus oryzae TaxID=7048 RepID=A0A6J2XYZ5_SITOR|nr:uncharacterized protein LOC115882164 [Sitophilus oryzae]